jgi:hypothetical protein
MSSPPAAAERSSHQKGLRLSRVLRLVLLASLVIAALISIVALVTGNFFGDIAGKMLNSMLVLALFSGTGLAAALWLDREQYVGIGFVGLATSVVAALSSLIVIWAEIDPFDPFEGLFDQLFRPWMIASISAVVLGHASLFMLIRPRSRPVALLKGGTLVALTLAWALLVVLTWLSVGGGGGEAMWRLFGVFGVLAVVGTLSVPILNKVLDAR